MHVLIVNRARVPVHAYGGTERVIWGLARNLTLRGHKVTFLVPEGSHCDFARVLPFNRKAPVLPQLPHDVDIVHFQFFPDFDPDEDVDRPYIATEHGNTPGHTVRPLNTVFVSRDHARRHHSDQFVYNGLDWSDYGPVDFAAKRTHCHFLGKAAWNVKNIGGAIDVAAAARVPMAVLGGSRLNVSRGFRFTLSPWARFHGMVGGPRKMDLLNRSVGHVFPVRWDEPFGLAMIESLYFGSPVFGTPYGSLRELIGPEMGYLSTSSRDLAEAIRSRSFDARRCHEYARDTFTAARMTDAYIALYETILNGGKLHDVRPYIVSVPKGLRAWDA
jgi:glycosyltransferase involved in cell wall biosynthesis